MMMDFSTKECTLKCATKGFSMFLYLRASGNSPYLS